jgi:hypothetical protein
VGWGRAVGTVSLDSCVHAVHSSQMACSGEQRAFLVEEFIQNGGSPIMTQGGLSQSTNKISGTGLSVTLGNFTNGHSTAPRLLCGVPFLSLVCGALLF